jgi:hypothetical protein
MLLVEAQLKEHLRERGVGYIIGFVLFLALVIPGLHDGLGSSRAFALAVASVVAVGIGGAAVVFGLWVLLARRGDDPAGRR